MYSRREIICEPETGIRYERPITETNAIPWYYKGTKDERFFFRVVDVSEFGSPGLRNKRFYVDEEHYRKCLAEKLEEIQNLEDEKELKKTCKLIQWWNNSIGEDDSEHKLNKRIASGRHLKRRRWAHYASAWKSDSDEDNDHSESENDNVSTWSDEDGVPTFGPPISWSSICCDDEDEDIDVVRTTA